MTRANGVFVRETLFVFARDLSLLRFHSIRQSDERVPPADCLPPGGAACLDMLLGVSHRSLLPAGGTFKLVEEGTVVLVVKHAQTAHKAGLKPARVVIAILREKCELLSRSLGKANSLAEGLNCVIRTPLRQLNQRH